jgi:hypothetical protein
MITHESLDTNSHGSYYPCLNRHGTLPQHPWDFKFLKKNSPQDVSMVAKTALASLPTFHNAPFDIPCGF